MIAAFTAVFAQVPPPALDCARAQVDIDAVDPAVPAEFSLNSVCTGAFEVGGGREVTLFVGPDGLFTSAVGDDDQRAQIRVRDGTLRIEAGSFVPFGRPAIEVVHPEAVLELVDAVVTPGAGGSGVFVGAGEATIEGALFVGGVALRGPHLRVDGGAARVVRTELRGGLALREGGSVYVGSGASLVVEDSVFVGNIADDGGAVAAAGSLEARRTRWLENRASGAGGAIRSTSGELVLVDSDLFENEAARGGALHAGAGGVVLQTATFCGNLAAEAGGAALLAGGDGHTVYNARFLGNRAQEGGALRVDGGALAEVWQASFLGNAALGGAAVNGGARLVRSFVGFSALGPAVEGGATQENVLFWSNAAGNVREAVVPDGGDPRFLAFSLDAPCELANDTYRVDSALVIAGAAAPALAGDPALCAEPSPSPPHHVGAYGGPCGWPRVMGVDADGDSWPALLDCDDGDAGVAPDAAEDWYNGRDEDCDGGDDYDRDGDGQRSEEVGAGSDCDDSDPRVYEGAPENGFDEDLNCDDFVETLPGTVAPLRGGCFPEGCGGQGGQGWVLVLPWVALARRRR